MIDEKKLIKEIADFKRCQKSTNCDYLTGYISALSAVEGMIAEQPKLGEWIPCSERLPEEHESVFAKAKGTDKWSAGMFEGISDDVNVTVDFDDGTRATKVSHTLDGVWECEKRFSVLKMKVVAWMPLPSSYKEEGVE